MTLKNYHGTIGNYTNHKCRCEDCRKAWAVYHLAYMKSHPEAREHLREWMRARYYRLHPDTRFYRIAAVRGAGQNPEAAS